MRSFISILLFFWATKVSSQSLCETKTPQLIYNKISSSYKIQDDIKPYRIDWYSHDTIIKTAMSHRTAPEQLISVPNFRHFKVCPHIQRNGDIYFLGDSFWHYSVFKVNFQTKTYDRQFNLSEHFTINRSFLDSFLAGKTIYGSVWLEDSCHDLSNCFVMDNDGMMYIDKVHIQNFIAFDPISKTYKLIDRFQEPVYGLMNFTEHNLLYIYRISDLTHNLP